MATDGPTDMAISTRLGILIKNTHILGGSETLPSTYILSEKLTLRVTDIISLRVTGIKKPLRVTGIKTLRVTGIKTSYIFQK